ncbi:MAG: T9SS type B sorting domain-containing protein, partial [Prevotellaceae bacterium]|nr:T9SS type B sorting domain-containing protein [Prevotellaceae bacterium]
DEICQHEKTSASGFEYLPAQGKSGIFTYKKNLTSTVTGCDSTVVLTLTVRPTYEIIFNERIPMGEAYRKNGFNITNTETPGKFVYEKELYTVANCDSVVRLNLTVYTDIVPPTMFSPDGDGINDTWAIKYIEVSDYQHVLIFDQFGKKLKEYSKNSFEPWDGTYLGKPVPSGDYWYQVKLPEGVKNGHFSLKRRGQ